MNNFDIHEFDCKCGCHGNKMTAQFLSMIDDARHYAEVPFIITSGYRCDAHNKAVGSTSTNHTSGNAADIQCTAGINRLRTVEGLIKAGFRRIGIAKTFIHADCNNGPSSIWLY